MAARPPQRLEASRSVNRKPERAGKPPTEIGIASGSGIAGYSGTQQHTTSPCVGDAVNLAARPEAHAKVAARRPMIDAATRSALDSTVPVEAVGALGVHEHASAIEVFAVGV